MLKDGRRIAVANYEIADERVYYERFDARVGIDRALVARIVVIPARQDEPALEDVILGRVLKAHKRRFSFGDFKRDDIWAAEIEPLLTPEEQTAYVRKLIRLQRREILEIEDKRQIAEMNGDIVDMGTLEKKLIAALKGLNEGQRALARLGQRHSAGQSGNGSGTNATPAAGHAAANDFPAREVASEASGGPDASLAQLQQQREMLVLVIKKNYNAGEQTGGVLARQKARQDLRVVDLQIRYFDHLVESTPTTSAPPSPRP